MPQADVQQIARFAVVGLSVALSYVALFTLFGAIGLTEGLANTLSFAAAICLQYLGQTLLTFRRRLAAAGQIFRFGLAVGLGYLVSMLLTVVVGPGLGWANWLSAAVVAVLLPVQNFLFFRLWVYARATA